MRWQGWVLTGLGVVLAFSVWLQVSTPFGHDLGAVGFALGVLTLLGAIFLIPKMPHGRIDDAVSLGEWRAWVGLAVTLFLAVFLVSRTRQVAGATSLGDVRLLAHILLQFLIVWVLFSRALRKRWRGLVMEDERDREIGVLAAGWGRGALVAGIVVVMVLLAFTPAARLAWATPVTIAHLLLLALLCGVIVEYAAAGITYWRDRRP